MGYRSRVRRLVARVRRFWVDLPGEPVRREPFAVVCRCGQTVQGLRRRHHQVVRCPACGASVFVLPSSPYPPLPGESAPAAGAAAPARPTSRITWRVPIIAGVVTLLVVVAVYVPLLWHLGDHSASRPQEETPREVIERHRKAGLKALADRDHAKAANELRAAVNRLEQDPQVVPASDGRRLRQLLKQAELLENRLPEPLDQLLQNWEKLDAQDLETVFRTKARDKAVFFDLEMQRNGAGQYQYWRHLGPVLPVLELQDVKLLNRLPLQNAAQRVIFGAKLAGLRKDANSNFIVSFDPDSGVLVTEEEVATVWGPAIDENTRAVLQRQQRWAFELP